MTDFRALCVELVSAWDSYSYADAGDATDRMTQYIMEARALLAQPEPQGPSDEEIEEWADASSEVPLEEMDPDVHGWRRCFKKEEFGASIRAALAHWRRPAIKPVSVSERLPGPEDCDAEGRCWWWDEDDDMWRLSEHRPCILCCTHWLPWHALPVPSANSDDKD
jgi:hypothetical protein